MSKMRRTAGIPGSEHYDADSMSWANSNLGSEKEGRMALDGIVRMVDAQRKCGRSTTASLRISELSPVERMKYRCKHRRLAERWRDMRLEGSKLDGLADPGALHEGRKLGLFEDMVQGSDLG